LLTIQGKEVATVSPEGVTSVLPLEDLAGHLRGGSGPSAPCVLPDGVKAIFQRAAATIWVHQSPPAIRRFKWIAEDSEVKFGRGTKYREVSIALPYVIILAAFVPIGRGRVSLSGHNECFFRSAPLSGPDDELFYPALLNCSKFSPQEGKPLSWICTQYLDRNFDADPDHNSRMRAGFRELVSCLFEAGFNYSSEHNEHSSWFSESTSRDARIATVEAWQEASSADPLFVLDVPWIPTGLSLAQVAGRTLDLHRKALAPFLDSRSLAHLVMKNGTVKGSKPEPPANTQTEIPF
jgi:hypothetical protein